MNLMGFAWISGIIALAINIPAIIIGLNLLLLLSNAVLFYTYIALSVVGLVFSIFFILGFVLLGKKLKNTFLLAISYVVIVALVIASIVNMALLFLMANFMLAFYLSVGICIMAGIVGILFGISILTIRKNFGFLAIGAGIMEIITACFWVSIVLAIVASFLYIPAMILEIIILYKASKGKTSRI